MLCIGILQLLHLIWIFNPNNIAVTIRWVFAWAYGFKREEGWIAEVFSPICGYYTLRHTIASRSKAKYVCWTILLKICEILWSSEIWYSTRSLCSQFCLFICYLLLSEGGELYENWTNYIGYSSPMNTCVCPYVGPEVLEFPVGQMQPSQPCVFCHSTGSLVHLVNPHGFEQAMRGRWMLEVKSFARLCRFREIRILIKEF